ncbi:hypothetical protein TWF281_006336 [Arthrobotrys megalospora]
MSSLIAFPQSSNAPSASTNWSECSSSDASDYPAYDPNDSDWDAKSGASTVTVDTRKVTIRLDYIRIPFIQSDGVVSRDLLFTVPSTDGDVAKEIIRLAGIYAWEEQDLFRWSAFVRYRVYDPDGTSYESMHPVRLSKSSQLASIEDISTLHGDVFMEFYLNGIGQPFLKMTILLFAINLCTLVTSIVRSMVGGVWLWRLIRQNFLCTLVQLMID